MQKVILITGSTDGIGLETAKTLVTQGHHVVVHGRNASKVVDVEKTLNIIGKGNVESLVADLSSFDHVYEMINTITSRFTKIDILINNAGIFSTQNTRTEADLDVRFMVNTIAPYLITKMIQPLLKPLGRVVNLSSAAQASVNLTALQGEEQLNDGEAYAQSKLALTMWSQQLGLEWQNTGPMVVAVNPKSFLGSKMVKDAYGVAGGDIQQGVDILVKAALSDDFSQAYGKYFDNDIGSFTSPHRDTLDNMKVKATIMAINDIVSKHGAP
ncbi:SDR family NAD(P)-dependent oxidoreductase [Vibrio pectenicida]|uniref:SDR family NAD(P)-dependent oxidoreductase n=1 Tax=Vibrio pectenicida TaxID=62763 RepID=A0A427U020_9VIBR|nr:SDR family NAD(P)-dependent oxidoreductase [Vibrio pectenicida]RSD29850.1 SDR family NAD(P)-dependent oxidoreductase [Vibrio pectenicida]